MRSVLSYFLFIASNQAWKTSTSLSVNTALPHIFRCYHTRTNLLTLQWDSRRDFSTNIWKRRNMITIFGESSKVYSTSKNWPIWTKNVLEEALFDGLQYFSKNMSTIVTKFVSSSLNHVSMAFYVKLQKSFCIVERKEIKFPLCRFEMMCGRKRSIIRSWLLYLAISHTKVYRISDCLHLGRRCDPNSFHFHYLMIVNS